MKRSNIVLYQKKIQISKLANVAACVWQPADALSVDTIKDDVTQTLLSLDNHCNTHQNCHHHPHIKFKAACLVHQLLSGQAPLYLADDCRLVFDNTLRSLWSADFFDLRAAANTQPLRRQNFCSRGTSPVELFQSSCVILTSPMDCSDDSWRDTFFQKHEHGALWLLICGAIEKQVLTYLHHQAHVIRQSGDPWQLEVGPAAVTQNLL